MADDNPEKAKYPIIADTLKNFEDKEEIHLWDSEMDDLIGAVQMQVAYDSNYGIRKERVEHNDRELAFQQEWLAENEPRRGNGYYGIIQLLFQIKKDSLLHPETVINISNRDRVIVATIIQWLGSNIGFSFLERSLKRCGYIIQSKKEYDLQHEEVIKARNIIKEAEKLITKHKS